MPKTPATPRTTRNSRGLRETTPTAGGRRSRESSVSSSDGDPSARIPVTRSRRSRESSVASDDGNQPIPTPRRRSQRSRSRSVEPTADATAASSNSQTTSPVARSQIQLPLPSVPENTPVTPRATGTSSRNFQGVAAAPYLTPIVEESPITATPISIPGVEQNLHEPSHDHISSTIVDETVGQPATIETQVPEQSAPRLTLSPTALVERPTTPLPLHRVGISLSLQPVTPLNYFIQIADDELQASIDCDESEEQGFDQTWIAVRRERTKARRLRKLQYRRDQFCRQWDLPGEFSETSHPLIIGEEPDQTTEKYVTFKKEEGHAFGARLLKTIKDDHERRGCECPLPQVYRDRAAAEAGEGTFRFFRQLKQPGFDNIWVFMRKSDWHWHCTCDKQPLSDFAVWVRRKRKAEEHKTEEKQAERQSRKRKAQDCESELTDPVTRRVVDGPCLPGSATVRRRVALLSAKRTTTVVLAGSTASRLRAKTARLLRSTQSTGYNLPVESAKSMCGIFSTRAITMGTSVKHFLSRVGAQLSTVWNFKQAQTAIENRTQDNAGNLVVKRLKRQHYVPVTTAEEFEAWEAAGQSTDPSPFDAYPWFEWTDAPAKYIGAHYLTLFRDLGDKVYNDLAAGRFKWGASEEALRESHEQGLERLGLKSGGTWDDEEFNLELSLRIYRHALEKHKVETYDELTDFMKDNTRKWWERCSAQLSRIIEHIYGNKYLISDLKRAFGPTPPKHLRGFWTDSQRDAARDARNFLVRFLWSGEELNDAMKLAVTRIVADMDAIYKRDIPYSLVEFPGKYADIMPGTWPLVLLEEVRTDDVYIEPIYEVQAPSREPEGGQDVSPTTTTTTTTPMASTSRVATPPVLLPARGILKEEKISFDFKPDSPRPHIRFSKNIVSFRSPQHKPQRSSAPKTVKGSRVEKKARPPKKTQELWALFISDMHNGLVKTTHSVHKIPMEHPEEQTMEEAGGPRLRKDPITGEMQPEAPPTKYEEFLDHTRQELFKGGWVIGPTTNDPRPPYDGTATNKTFPRSQEAHDSSMVTQFPLEKFPRKDTKQDGYRPVQFAHLALLPVKPKPAKTVEQVKEERDLLLNDLEINIDGKSVRPNVLFPDSELPIATKKLDDLHLNRQLREEAQAGAERLRVELAKKIEEEKRRREAEERRKAEEERRRREEEERREAEERRRIQEATSARRREEERDREAARRRGALGLRRPARAIITPLSDTWRSRVSGIQHSPDGIGLAKTPEGQELTRRDFVEKLLPPTAWLNDNIIIGSIQHIGDLVNDKAGATKDNPKCATFTSYFWPRLESVGPASCGRMMRRAGVRKDNFKNIETILIPICSGNHWTLAVVLPQKGAILHMDSLRGGRGNPSVTNKILEWVKTTLAEDFVASEWSVINIDGPAQTNGWDCGVFTIVNGLCMALGLDPKESYAAGQLRTARSMLAAILLNDGFKGEFDLAGV